MNHSQPLRAHKAQQAQIAQQANHHTASATWDGTSLTITTGVVTRTWACTDQGLATQFLGHADSANLIAHPGTSCDWQVPGLPIGVRATVIDVTIDTATDEGFTGTYVRSQITFRYEQAGIDVRHETWAFPKAPGLRTVLHIRQTGASGQSHASSTSVVAVTAESLGLARGDTTAIGFYNDTQHRNTAETPLIKVEAIPADGVCDWASMCAIELADYGCLLVKESHRCVNSLGHDCGAFILGGDGLRSTGWGIYANEITAEFSQAWAHWTIVYATTHPEQCARTLRQFMAQRWPHDAKRDTYTLANTWGSTAASRDARDAAREANVLREIDCAKAIGVDVLQIDDGWQVDLAATNWQPEDCHGWHPHPAVYPQGWTPVREYAQKNGVKLGLWAAGMPISLAELQRNYQEGQFSHFKLDFMVLTDHQRISGFAHKVRQFVGSTQHQVRINFDVTEQPSRVGYLWLREAGSLYLANRKPHAPESVIYVPHLMLRDAWHLSRWQRLQSIQITMQNPLRVDRRTSDAYLHGTTYCLAISLMATPVLFQQLQFLDTTQRADIARLLACYRMHREAIHGGDIEPIGAVPNNQSHSGFHCRCADGSGYLMLFRERLNGNSQWKVELPNITAVIDCERQTSHPVINGTLTINIPEAPGYRFLRYEV